MNKGRNRAGREFGEVDAEVGETEVVTEPMSDTPLHLRSERLGVQRWATQHGNVDRGNWLDGHVRSFDHAH
jgi:hypothetical protein